MSPHSHDELDPGLTPGLTPVMVHLSGAHRGTIHALLVDEAVLGTAAAAVVHLSEADRPTPGERHAVLKRRGRTYELIVEPGYEVWVNGDRVDRLVLAAGDVLEIGKSGPVLRYRMMEPGANVRPTVSEVVGDCVECARRASDSPFGQAAAFMARAPRDLATRTSGRFRGIVVLALVVLTGSTVLLAQRNRELQSALETEMARITELAQQLEQAEPSRISSEDIEQWRAELSAEAREADRRLDQLEERSGAAARIVREASVAIAFLQGGYGFRDPESGRPLRLILGADGQPVRNALGQPQLTLTGEGPVFEVDYTGTGFVASADGLILTNRHVALPWDFNPAAQLMLQRGLEPVMLRFKGYLPGTADPFDVTLEASNPDADVAVLRCSGVADSIPHLVLSEDQPDPGDEVIVMGYPLGLRALLARAEPDVAQQITSEGAPSFWETARRLSEGGHIAPLASRGIVSQVTSQFVVYDAETTSGGSGGPVLDLDGRVVAINAAVLPEFGGSNLGVPVIEARELIESRPNETR